MKEYNKKLTTNDTKKLALKLIQDKYKYKFISMNWVIEKDFDEREQKVLKKWEL